MAKICFRSVRCSSRQHRLPVRLVRPPLRGGPRLRHFRIPRWHHKGGVISVRCSSGSISICGSGQLQASAIRTFSIAQACEPLEAVVVEEILQAIAKLFRLCNFAMRAHPPQGQILDEQPPSSGRRCFQCCDAAVCGPPSQAATRPPRFLSPWRTVDMVACRKG